MARLLASLAFTVQQKKMIIDIDDIINDINDNDDGRSR